GLERHMLRRTLIAAGLAVLIGAGPIAAPSSSPVADAAMRGDRDAVRALLKQGADANAPQGDGRSALHHAAERGDAELCDMLLYAGADANAKDAEWGQTPLIYAAAQNRADAIRLLIARGADPKVSTKTIDIAKQNALDRAATERQRKVLEAAVPKGQQPTAS